MKIIPLNNHILVDVKEMNDKTKSGIILTGQDLRMEMATVVAVDKNIEDIKKGDIIFFKTYSISPVKFEDKEYFFMKGDEVLGIQK